MGFKEPSMSKFTLSERDITPAQFEQFKNFLRTSCGVILGDNKRYLLINRLERLIDQHGVNSFDHLLKSICSGSNQALRLAVIEAMTTHETFWFRDVHPFEELKNILKKIAKEKSLGGEIRIWSAACSTGQEPYSIAMIVDELNQTRALGGCRVSVFATDVADATIEQAKRGTYPNLAVGRGLNTDIMGKYFSQNSAGDWVISPRVKGYVNFKRFNLIEPYMGIGKFDIVFIRNVLIYFSKEQKQDIIERIGQLMPAQGYLFLGASESFQAKKELFTMERYQQGIVYRRNSN